DWIEGVAQGPYPAPPPPVDVMDPRNRTVTQIPPQEAVGFPLPTNIIALADTDPAIFEQNSLLGQFRFLAPEGMMLLVGPSGIGKSSLGMQMDILWSLG